MCWEGPWTYGFNGFDFDEMYDLENDPFEPRELADSPEHADRARRMMTRIWRRIRETRDHTLLNTHYHSARFGIVGPEAGLVNREP